MKILIIAMINSIHTARWLSYIEDEGWEIILFPTNSFVAVHPLIKKVKVVSPRVKRFFINFFKNKKRSSKGAEIIDLYPF